ncbi:hypothetical protein [Arenimonas sp. MALMAid1274]|uniref:hypothetical protein n=1 Tax=Arenimonas sp. MALMAid1274 TaxID=3411630 RepID=UPI003BA0E85C
MAALGGMILVVALVAFVLGLLIGGLVLKFSVRLIESFSPGYGKSVLVVFLAGVVGFVINIIVAMVMGVGATAASQAASADPTMAGAGAMMASLGASAISLVASLFVSAFFINLIIKHPDGRAIGYGRSCLVALLYLVVMVVIAIVASIGLGILMAMLGLGAASMMGG